MKKLHLDAIMNNKDTIMIDGIPWLYTRKNISDDKYISYEKNIYAFVYMSCVNDDLYSFERMLSSCDEPETPELYHKKSIDILKYSGDDIYKLVERFPQLALAECLTDIIAEQVTLIEKSFEPTDDSGYNLNYTAVFDGKEYDCYDSAHSHTKSWEDGAANEILKQLMIKAHPDLDVKEYINNFARICYDRRYGVAFDF